MALIAIGIHQLIIAAGMARLTWHREMRTCKCEFGRAVVERCRLPCGRRVTRLTALAEIAGYVIRIRRSGEVGSMALIAG
jgi:hypothetical protein